VPLQEEAGRNKNLKNSDGKKKVDGGCRETVGNCGRYLSNLSISRRIDDAVICLQV
jgi:hypothetical protein